MDRVNCIRFMLFASLSLFSMLSLAACASPPAHTLDAEINQKVAGLRETIQRIAHTPIFTDRKIKGYVACVAPTGFDTSEVSSVGADVKEIGGEIIYSTQTILAAKLAVVVTIVSQPGSDCFPLTIEVPWDGHSWQVPPWLYARPKPPLILQTVPASRLSGEP